MNSSNVEGYGLSLIGQNVGGGSKVEKNLPKELQKMPNKMPNNELKRQQIPYPIINQGELKKTQQKEVQSKEVQSKEVHSKEVHSKIKERTSSFDAYGLHMILEYKATKNIKYTIKSEKIKETTLKETIEEAKGITSGGSELAYGLNLIYPSHIKPEQPLNRPQIKQKEVKKKVDILTSGGLESAYGLNLIYPSLFKVKQPFISFNHKQEKVAEQTIEQQIELLETSSITQTGYGLHLIRGIKLAEKHILNGLEDQLENRLEHRLDNLLEDQLENRLDNSLKDQLENRLDNPLENQLENRLDNLLEPKDYFIEPITKVKTDTITSTNLGGYGLALI